MDTTNNQVKPIAWSHSTINSYLTCPKQYHEVKVLKRYKDDNEYASWGDRVHKYFEKQLLNEQTTDRELGIYDPIIERFRGIKGTLFVERQMAITNAYRPTQWFAKDVWCRGKADAMWIDKDVGIVIDWKAGKRKFDIKQLQLLALLTFHHHPEVERINAGFMWLQTGALDVECFRREDIHAMWQELLPDVRRFEQAHKTGTWTPKPSGLCKGYCKVLSCHFNEGFKEHGDEVEV